MKDYYSNLDEKIKKYFRILEPEFPEWLNEYINTKELLSQKYISVTCGTIYSKLFESDFFFSSLDHSVAVALIIWHFTHDKKQTLSGLLHDIATPVFKHSIDFLNGDYMKQESTEGLTTKIIEKSKQITELLRKDKIDISEVDNYHIYSIADNETPKLCADRLEYSLSNALFIYNVLDVKGIKEIYNDIEIQKNEESVKELAFRTKEMAIKFVKLTSYLSIMYRQHKTRYSMQFLADVLRCLEKENKISKNDLYTKKEKDIVKIMEESEYKNIFNIWINAEEKQIKTSQNKPQGKYYVRHGAKIRYIDPLINGRRISIVSENARKMIEENLEYNMNSYVYMDEIETFM